MAKLIFDTCQKRQILDNRKGKKIKLKDAAKLGDTNADTSTCFC